MIKKFIYKLYIIIIGSFLNFNEQNFHSADIPCNFSCFQK